MDFDTLGIVIAGLAVFVVILLVWGTVRFINSIRQGKALGSGQGASTPEAIAKLPVDAQMEQMRKSIRSWGWIMLAFGGISLVLGQYFSAPWGIIQILIGLASFYFVSDYPMFMVYAGAFLWAGIMNVLATISGSGTLGGAGIIQFIFAFQNFKLFSTYQAATRTTYAAAAAATPGSVPGEPPPLWEAPVVRTEETRAQHAFAWVALAMGLGSLIGFIGIFVLIFMLSFLGATTDVPPFMDFALEVAMLLGVMAIPVGIAALRAGYKPKAAGIVGLVAGVIMTMIYLGFVVIGWMAG